jgi:hypothetical protein
MLSVGRTAGSGYLILLLDLKNCRKLVDFIGVAPLLTSPLPGLLMMASIPIQRKAIYRQLNDGRWFLELTPSKEAVGAGHEKTVYIPVAVSNSRRHFPPKSGHVSNKRAPFWARIMSQALRMLLKPSQILQLLTPSVVVGV